MHGYQANLELERRQVRDWAGISRPQVYYSLEKLQRLGMLRAKESKEPAAGPERTVFTATPSARAALAAALEREQWTKQRDRPAFLTWLALSWQARPCAGRKQLRHRRKFLEAEHARKQTTLQTGLQNVSPHSLESVCML